MLPINKITSVFDGVTAVNSHAIKHFGWIAGFFIKIPDFTGTPTVRVKVKNRYEDPIYISSAMADANTPGVYVQVEKPLSGDSTIELTQSAATAGSVEITPYFY